MSDIPEIDIDTLEQVLVDGHPLIDVREDDEYIDAHVAGAVHIPLSTIPDRIGDIPSTGPVYVICALGGRSARAAEFLRAQGLDAINVAGGTHGWIESGRPVDRGPSTD